MPYVHGVRSDSEILFNYDDETVRYNDYRSDEIKRKCVKIYTDCRNNMDKMTRTITLRVVEILVKNNGSVSYEGFNHKLDSKYMTYLAFFIIAVQFYKRTTLFNVSSSAICFFIYYTFLTLSLDPDTF